MAKKTVSDDEPKGQTLSAKSNEGLAYLNAMTEITIITRSGKKFHTTIQKVDETLIKVKALVRREHD